ncbi:hypothetical protein AOG1_26860 [Geobacter sp. AOG1]|nr:hypothetical protein AOG1_26860 [Geobacter sp. AOG1]
MGEDTKCNSEEKHQCHMCVLRNMGLTSKIKQLTRTPNVACSKCGEEANSKDCVCIPVQLFI